MVRLIQEAHNVVAYSLYLKVFYFFSFLICNLIYLLQVGFKAKDQITVFEGKINQNYTGELQV